MKPLGDPNEHYWRVQRMAKAVGSDLAAAQTEGRLSDQDWADMVTRCRGCSVTCACSDWLDRAEMDGRTRDSAIPGCENKLVFPKL
ncbi:DUF6455 family protein [Pseudooceanicola algae]|uniref:DUF6455 domain-containing protein n=1 Tax=Pseudooceanicola algae TaxID=1537215 RepID=A0A418SHY8_9RHOB|nr:DUF6455 family protein [Pseudooceanicola algae]QPM92102.1 hypothetical protein PSAL_033650 [Pseudooceanicola algae]